MASPSALEALYIIFESRQRPRLVAYGRYVATHQVTVLLSVAVVFCLAVCSPLAALIHVSGQVGASGGFRKFILRPHAIPDGTGLRHLSLYRGEPCWSRCAKDRHIIFDQLWLTSEAHLRGAAGEHGALERSTLHGALKVQQAVLAQLENDPLAQCVKDAQGQCAIVSPLQAWHGSEAELLSDPDPLETLAQLRGGYTDGGLHYLMPWTLVGMQAHGTRSLHRANFLGLLTMREANSAVNMSDVFSRALGQDAYKIGDAPHGAYAQIVIKPDADITKGASHAYYESFGFVFVYAIVGFYVFFRLRRMTRIHSKPGLIFTALIQMLMTGLMSLRICSEVGLRVDLVPWQFMPFLTLVLGVDNIYVLSTSISATSLELSLADRVGEGFAAVGCPLFLTFLSELVFFSSGFVMLPKGSSWKEASGFVVVALSTDYALQSTYYLTVLSIDTMRLEMAELLVQNSLFSPKQPRAHKASQTINEKLVISSLGFLAKGLLEAIKARMARTYTLVFLALINLALYLRQGSTLIPSTCGPMNKKAPIPSDWTDNEKRYWHVLNPDDAPQVHISITAPQVIALGATALEPLRTVPSHLQLAQTPSFLLAVVLPTSLLVTTLYLVLYYLIKDRHYIAAEKKRAALQREEEAEAARERNARPRAVVDGISTLSELDIEALAVGSKVIVSWALFDDSITVSKITEFFEVPTGAIELMAQMPLETASPPLMMAVSHDDYVAVAYVGRGVFHFFSLAEQRKLHNLHVEVSATDRLIALFALPTRSVDAPPLSNSGAEEPKAFVAVFSNGQVLRLVSHEASQTELLAPSAVNGVKRNIFVSPTCTTSADEPRYLVKAEAGQRYQLVRIADEGIVEQGSFISESTLVSVSVRKLKFGGEETIVMAALASSGQVTVFNGQSGDVICNLNNKAERPQKIRSVRLGACAASVCSRCSAKVHDGILVILDEGIRLVVKRIYKPNEVDACRCTVGPPRSPGLTGPESEDTGSPPITPKKTSDNGLSAVIPTHGAVRRSSTVRDRREFSIDPDHRPPLVSPDAEPGIRVLSVCELDIERDGAWHFVGGFLLLVCRSRAEKARTSFSSEWQLLSIDLRDPNNEIAPAMTEALTGKPVESIPPMPRSSNVKRRHDPLSDPPSRAQALLSESVAFARGRHFTPLPKSRALIALGNSVALIDASASSWSNARKDASLGSRSPLRSRKIQ